MNAISNLIDKAWDDKKITGSDLRPAERELEQLIRERDGFKSIVEEVIESLEEHALKRTLEAVKSDYEDVLLGKYQGKGI